MAAKVSFGSWMAMVARGLLGLSEDCRQALLEQRVQRAMRGKDEER